MLSVLDAIAIAVVNLFTSRTRLEAWNVFLRHQLNIAVRRAPARLRLTGAVPTATFDRLFAFLVLGHADWNLQAARFTE